MSDVPPNMPPPPGYGPPGGAGGYPPAGAPYAPGGYGPREHPQGTTILVLGILSLVICGLLGPVAWSMGNKAIAEIDGQPGTFTNRGAVAAGRICGMIATILIGVAIVLFIILAAAGS